MEFTSRVPMLSTTSIVIMTFRLLQIRALCLAVAENWPFSTLTALAILDDISLSVHDICCCRWLRILSVFSCLSCVFSCLRWQLAARGILLSVAISNLLKVQWKYDQNLITSTVGVQHFFQFMWGQIERHTKGGNLLYTVYLVCR